MGSSKWVDNSGYTEIELFPDGTYKSFVPTIVTEWQVQGKIVKMRVNRKVQFYPNGSLLIFTLNDDIVLSAFGVPVRLLFNTVIEFFEDGNLKKVTLNKQKNGFFGGSGWTYRGKKYKPGTVIEFSQEGNIIAANPA